jgi:riboflavin biosynthesis pyrimidine reductase
MPDERPSARLDLLGAAETLDAGDFVRRALQETATPRLLLNFVATADGLATIDGRSGPIGGSGDRAVFHALRAHVDAVMVGAGTARVENYGPLVSSPQVQAEREARGLQARPLAVIVSKSVNLPAGLPLLEDPQSRILVITNGDRELAPAAATVDYIRIPGPAIDLAAGVSELRSAYRADTILCEGGPTLAGSLFAAGVVDELWLTIGPRAGGGAPGPRILAGPALEPPARLELRAAARCGQELFLRYGAESAARVSRITTD